jgi:phosphorylcholine metabolism protein LicD
MEILDCLKDMKMVLDTHKIVFWLEHGTLLGAIRKGKMIEGDYDVDFATFSKNAIPKIEEISRELYKLGYDTYNSDTKLTIRRDGNHISLYFYKDKIYGETKYVSRDKVSKKDFIGNVLQYVFLQAFNTPHKDYMHKFTLKTKSLYLAKKIVMKLPAKKQLYDLLLSFGKKTKHLFTYHIDIKYDYVSKFKTVDFYDIKLNVPISSEEYLEYMYGKNWRVPDKNWDVWSLYKQIKGNNIKLDLLTHLSLIVDILNKNKIHFWMYGGALLGYVRNKELIPWDRDVDLFVWEKDYSKIFKIKNEFKKLGFKFLIRESTVMLKWSDKNITIGKYKLEGDYAIREKLVTKNRIGNIIYFGFLVKAVKYNMKHTYRFLKWLSFKLDGCYQIKQIVPSKFYLDLKEIDFFGVNLRVPKDTKAYLEYTYGNDWKMPKKKFKYTKEYIQVTKGKKPSGSRIR